MYPTTALRSPGWEALRDIDFIDKYGLRINFFFKILQICKTLNRPLEVPLAPKNFSNTGGFLLNTFSSPSFPTG